MTIAIQIKDTASAGLDKIKAALASAKPLWKIVGEYMVGETDTNFREQGRPTRWQGLAESTILSRLGGKSGTYTKKGKLRLGAARKLAGMLTLIVSGRLKNSIVYEAGPGSVTIGSNLVQARIQQLGGLAGRGHKTQIPARPYLIALPQNRDWIAGQIEDYLKEAGDDPRGL